MPTQKRERKRQGQQARQAAAASARKRQQSRSRAIAGGFLALVLIAGVAVLVNPGGDDQDVASTGPTTTTVAGAATTVAGKKPVELPPIAPGASVKGDTPCPPADGSAPRTTSFEKPPPLCVEVAKTYVADIQTSKGLMTVALDVRNATKTVNNFVVLARYKYFDGIAFHRIIPGFVIQGGDPQQTGSGGPGYKIEDELPKAGSYKLGSLAMANSSQPKTNGSQFFIVAGDAGASLPPSYSLFGQVVQGLEVVKAIEEVGIPGTQDGKPSEVVKIITVNIKET
ncbi:MAG: peptidylprolyl isomerase [Acidimicrobiales bacterium]